MFNTQNNTQEQIKEKNQTLNNGVKFETIEFEKNDHDEQILKMPRTSTFLEAIAAIDLLNADDVENIDKIKNQLSEEANEDFSNMTTAELLEELLACIEEEFVSVNPKKKAVGILGKCMIQGCDYHLINDKGDIHHYKVEEDRDKDVKKAIELYESKTDVKCIEIYEYHQKIVYKNGEVESVKVY